MKEDGKSISAFCFSRKIETWRDEQDAHQHIKALITTPVPTTTPMCVEMEVSLLEIFEAFKSSRTAVVSKKSGHNDQTPGYSYFQLAVLSGECHSSSKFP